MKRKRPVVEDEGLADGCPPTGRRKGSHGYQTGAIKRIVMTNFMSYNYAAFCPGPHLNLIVAPNGCGKSTIVAAICLGLAGRVALLGKSNQVRDFVQRGKPFAELELELYAADHSTVTVKRRIEGGTSRWYIDGKEKGERDVAILVSQLNIKLENLTQFLPQERVKGFAQLSPTALLEATEEAVLPPEVLELHAKLIEEGRSHHVSQQQLEQLEKKCQRLKDLNQVDLRDVERFQQQQQLLRKAAEFALGVPYAEHGRRQEAGKRLKAEHDAKRAELEQQRKALQPLEAAWATAEKAVKAAESELSRLEATIKTTEEESAKHQKEFEQLGRDIEGLAEEEGQLAGRERQRQENLARAQRQHDVLAQQLTALEPPQEAERRAREKSGQVRRYDAQDAELGQAIEDIDNRMAGHKRELAEVDAQLALLTSLKDQRLRACQALNPQCVDVWRWIEANRHRLQGNVYMPALELDIKEGEHTARYLEACLPNYFLFGIICEERADRDLISAELKDKQRKQFTAIARKLDAADEAAPRRLCPIERLQPLGVTHWLDQAVAGPPVVLAVMRDMAPVHLMAVGKRDINIRLSQQLCTELRTVFTPQFEYSTRQSRYGARLLSTTVSQLREPRLFRATAPHDSRPLLDRQARLRQTLAELQAGKAQKREERAKLATTRELLMQERMQLQGQVQEHQRLKRAVDQRARELRQLAEEGGQQQEQARIAESVRLKRQRRQELVGAVRHALQRHVDAATHRGLLRQRRRALQRTADAARETQIAAQRQLKGAMAQCEAAQRAFDDVQAQLQDLRSQFNAQRAQFMQQWKVTQAEANDLCRALPTDPELLRAEAQRCEAEADAIVADPQKVAEFKRRKAEIEGLEGQIARHKRGVEEQQQKLEEWKERWLRPLQAAIRKLDETFQKYCQYQGIQGAVRLEAAEGARPEDYALHLLCSFRRTEALERLTAHRQSGGERAVVTMLYLLALQSMNICPIRVVDEIDQGMDADNQRKMFLKMLESSAADEAPQSFLITPKFTLGLVPEDAPHLDVFVVLNGPLGVPQDLFAGVAHAG